jgi:DNA repair protein SbcD/Mre11
MRIVHTADWHIGHTLGGWSRDAEHRVFFRNMCDLVEREEVDAMLVAGDVFDTINPSGEAMEIFFSAMADLKRARPSLTTVISSGNHDPAYRLQAPRRVLEELGIHVFGAMSRRDGVPDAEAHMVPLKDAQGRTRAYALAIPFLRAADLSGLSFSAEEGRAERILDAVRSFHDQAAGAAIRLADGLPVLMTGHLHCRGAVESEGSERRVLIGGEHAVPPDIFHPGLAYVALGHLHAPQDIETGRIRYSGSCFPLSVSEIAHQHGVTLVDLSGAGPRTRHLPLPRPAPLLRVPERGAIVINGLEEALQNALQASGCLPVEDPGLNPLIHVELEATDGASILSAEAMRILARYPVRLAGIKIQRTLQEEPEALIDTRLQDIDPEELFRRAWVQRNGFDPEDRHLMAFRDILSEV